MVRLYPLDDQAHALLSEFIANEFSSFGLENLRKDGLSLFFRGCEEGEAFSPCPTSLSYCNSFHGTQKHVRIYRIENSRFSGNFNFRRRDFLGINPQNEWGV